MKTKIFIKLLYCISILFIVPNCSDQEAAKIPRNIPTPAQMLIIDDAGSNVDAKDLKVKRAQYLLEQLSSIWKTPTDSIADFTFKGKQLVLEKGIEETNLNILEQQYKMVKDNIYITHNSKYSDAIVLYIMARN